MTYRYKSSRFLKEIKFHHDEMFNGAGKSMNELLIILISGWELQMLVINMLIVEIQLFFMSLLVMVKSHVRMMTYIVFILTMFVVKFCRFLFKIFIVV